MSSLSIKKIHQILPSISIAILLLSVAVGLFLALQSKGNAADMRKFDPGNIMSDTVMSDKTTMSVAQIQSFLNSKNACNNTNTHWAKSYPHLQYTIKNGKFVCMAQDRFNGKTAAELIWKTGQDFNINPQVLIALLEKEQGLVSDTWPNHIQYRSATGFGCPDNLPPGTPPCAQSYWGLENQLRFAARLFREVLNGGWSNYPVGQTFVQWHPNKSCGGSTVTIKNRATSALYRYTPYQPNQAALNAGYGTGNSCSSYGNRNFWALFTDWFGSTQKDMFSRMDVERKLAAKSRVSKINPTTGKAVPGQVIEKDQVVSYSSKATTLSGNKLCLRTEANTRTNDMMCVLYDNLQEGPSFTAIKSTKMLPEEKVSKVDPIDNTAIPNQVIQKGQVVEYTSQATSRADGKPCLRAKADTVTNSAMCVPKDKLTAVPTFKKLGNDRKLVAKAQVYKINPETEKTIKNQVIQKGQMVEYSSQISTFISGKPCLRTKANTATNSAMCVLENNLKEYKNPNFKRMDVPRKIKTSKTTIKIDPITGEKVENLPAYLPIDFEQRTEVNGKLCLRTKIDTSLNKQACVLYENLKEI